MDSKLKRFCIVCSFSVMVLVVLLVVYINRENKQLATAGNPTAAPMHTEAPVVIEAEGIQTDKGLQIGHSLSAFLEDEDFFDKIEEAIE